MLCLRPGTGSGTRGAMAGSRQRIPLLAAFLLSACAGIDFDYPRTDSHALTSTDDTYLGKQLAGRIKARLYAERSGRLALEPECQHIGQIRQGLSRAGLLQHVQNSVRIRGR